MIGEGSKDSLFLPARIDTFDQSLPQPFCQRCIVLIESWSMAGKNAGIQECCQIRQCQYLQEFAACFDRHLDHTQRHLVIGGKDRIHFRILLE